MTETSYVLELVLLRSENEFELHPQNKIVLFLFGYLETENVVKPNYVQSRHGRPSASTQIWLTVSTKWSLVTLIRFVATTKIPGQAEPICVLITE